MAHETEDPLLMLIKAHQNLRRQLHQLIRVGRLAAVGRADFRLVPILSNAGVFVAHDVALHTRDEEETLHPRLRAKLKDSKSHFAYLLQHLEDDHREFAPLHEKLQHAIRELTARLPLEGNVPPATISTQLRAFRGIVAELWRLYSSHMLVEERDIFPAIQVIFTPGERSEMAAEMTERRMGHSAPRSRRAIFS